MGARSDRPQTPDRFPPRLVAQAAERERRQLVAPAATEGLPQEAEAEAEVAGLPVAPVAEAAHRGQGLS